MAFIQAPTFAIKQITWSLDRPASVNQSAYTGARTVTTNPWFGRWHAQVELAQVQSDADWSALRSFFARCQGVVNTFKLSAVTEAQNANVGVKMAADAAAGSTQLSVSNATTPLAEGQYFTVNGQLCCCTAPQSMTTLTFEPPLRETAYAGTYVETANPFAVVYLSQSQIEWNVSPYRLFDLTFNCDEVLADDPVLFFDTFTDQSGTNPARAFGRNVISRLVGGYEFGNVPGKWNEFCGTWATDGAGYVNPTATAGDTQNLLNGCLLHPAGTAGDRKITVVLKSDFNSRPGVVVATDGRYFLGWEFGVSNTIRIRQLDAHQFAPTYSSTPGNAWVTLATSALVTPYTTTADNTFVAELTNTGTSPILTVTHVESGISVSTTAGQITVPIGASFGIRATNATPKFKSVKVEGENGLSYFNLGNGVQLVDARIIEFMGDADGISMADRNGDGLPDLAIGNSSNNNGTIGGIYTATQSRQDAWAFGSADINSSISVTDRYNGVEGVCLVPINSYRYLFINDTPTQGQYLLDLQTGARIQMSTYGAGQDCRAITIQGSTCILSTHEGAAGTTGITHGGVVLRRFLGGDPMVLANWQEVTVSLRPGAWAFQKSNFGFVNLNGDGVLWLVYGARDSGSNIDVTAPGLYAVPVPATPFSGPWAGEISLYLPGDGNDFINWDFGDFSGDGNGFDVVYAVLNQQGAPKYLRKSTGWTSTATVTLGLATANHLYNVMKTPVKGTGTRDSFIAWNAYQGFYHIYWNGSAWVSQIFRGDPHDHGWNACNGPIWNRGDGTYSVFIGDSFGSQLLDLRFRKAP